MEWYIILALAVGVFVILFPIAYVWYLNVGGVYSAIKKAREKQVAGGKEAEVSTPVAIVSKPGIREVQVFRRASEKGITQPIGHNKATRDEKKAGFRQPE
ncbi:MAG: hypothetical protein FJ004_02440 [Chloroflexi bacterium]|nr:hypothetical protein [Chloroflexota bacterium]